MEMGNKVLLNMRSFLSAKDMDQEEKFVFRVLEKDPDKERR